jgi:aspartate-semialdehyde dehydrogenase
MNIKAGIVGATKIVGAKLIALLEERKLQL